MALLYRIAADVIVIFHMAYVLTVVLGLPAIWVGIVLKHQWARNFWWRCGHLAMILIVVAEAWAGITCPLTTWEAQLRRLANQETYEGAFIANMVHEYLFYKAPHWVFTLIYTTFGTLVLASFVVAPPYWPKFEKSNRPVS
jgi:hypothetical protein